MVMVMVMVMVLVLVLVLLLLLLRQRLGSHTTLERTPQRIPQLSVGRAHWISGNV